MIPNSSKRAPNMVISNILWVILEVLRSFAMLLQLKQNKSNFSAQSD